MKSAILLFFCFLMVSFSGCASSRQTLLDEYPDRISVNPPQQIPYVEKQIYVNNIEPRKIGRNHALIIQGDFPNPCTQILRVSEDYNLDTLNLKLLGWQKFGEACTTALTPFTFIFEIPRDDFEGIEKIDANGTVIELSEEEPETTATK